MRARRAENAEGRDTAVPCPGPPWARRRWQQLYRCLRRAQPGPERSGGTRPTPPSQLKWLFPTHHLELKEAPRNEAAEPLLHPTLTPASVRDVALEVFQDAQHVVDAVPGLTAARKLMP